MAEFIFTPAAVRDPKNHPRRIYFSCHSEDMLFFDVVAAKIRDIEPDCVIAYADPEGDEARRMEELEEFHLTVVPITENWFREGHHTREFARLAAAHKAILPILYDDSLEKQFNETTDNLQFLRIGDPDFTEKLRRTLRDILFDSQFLGKVRNVFTHKMFVSYCREDVEQARRLIRCVHSVESGKRISIWYDKYLPMGKNFEESIFSELDDSHFFAVTLTPSLLSRENYVKSYEYPHAQDGEKKIIFFELAPVDRKKLLEQLERADEYACISPENAKDFAAFVRRLTEENPGEPIQLNAVETDYLLGLAYQNGLFVEFDHPYAAQKFKNAANHQHADAAHALANMYYRGVGIARDMKKALSWYKKEVRIAEQAFHEAVEQLRRMKQVPFVKRHPLTGQLSGADETALAAMQEAVDAVCDTTRGLVVRGCSNARILRDEGRINGAEQMYRTVLDALDLIDSIANRLELGEKYRSGVANEMNAMLLHTREVDAEDCVNTWLACLKQYTDDPKEYMHVHGLLHSAHNYGTMLLEQQRFDEARRVMQQALDAAEDAARDPKIRDDRPLCELRLLLRRDVSRVYTLEEAATEEQRAANSQKALCAFETLRRRLEEVPFALEENPYLYTMKPWTRLFDADAYAYVSDHNRAYAGYLQGLAEMFAAEKTLGDRAESAAFALPLLQFYAYALTKLSRYGTTEQTPMLRATADQLLRRYQAVEFAGENRSLAQQNLKMLERAQETLREKDV